MNDHAARIKAAIAALEAQRTVLGDGVVDTAIAPLRGQLAAVQTPAAEQQLKQATVLFADIVGSTALSQRLDPEDVHTIMDGALARFTAIAQAHHGRVLNYAGDSMLAVFGADTAREDDPEHAVRAGLALLAEGRAQGEKVLRHHGHEGFDVRVGIHTGPVLLGGGVDAKDSIRGMTVNVAARMEQSAPSGTLRISHDTYRLVRGVFDVESQPPLLVKGHDEPITTYLVQRAKPRAFRVKSRGIDGIETPMVGRYAELGALCDGFESVLADRSLYAVTVVGDAGLGKSRLLAEFQNTLETHPQPFWLLLGRSQPHSGLQAYGLLRDVLAWRFQIADSDNAELARRKLVDGMGPLFAEEGELSAHLLGQLIGLDFSASPLLVAMLGDARQLRDRAFQAGAQLLRRLAASDGSPLVMLLDDLHWADDGSLDFVRYLLQQQRDLPLLLVMLARPALFERRADWTDADTRHRRIDVTPLSPEASSELTDVLLHRMTEVPDVLRAMVTSGAEGNPFYMEELIKMLVDDGVIAVDGEGWHVRAERLLTARVPSTLTGVLQARLDALAPAERSALQQAAVIGHVFWDAALAALQPAATDALPALLRKELIVRRDGSAFGDAIEYAFQHHLLQQVSYDTVLKAQRRAGHIGAAAWLVQHLGERTGEYLAVAAEHYERGGDEVRALDYFEKAALDAERRYATAAGLAHIDRALASPQLTDLRRRWKLLNTKSLLLDLQGNRGLQQTILVELEALADVLDDDALRAKSRVSRALLADRLGDLATALTLAREAWMLAERADDDDSAALALGEMAWVHCARGELDEARRHAELGLVWARRRPELHEGKLLLVAAEIANVAADYAQTGRLLQQARERVCATTASRRLECTVLSGSGELAQRLGDWPQAHRYAEATLRAARDLGSPQLEGHTFLNLSTCCFEQGDAATALAHARAATQIHQRIGDRRGEAACRRAEGLALSALADWPEAQRAFGQALAIYELIGDERRVRSTVSSVAQMYLDRGQAPQALAQVEKILERRHYGDGDAIDLEVMLTCHRVLAAAGDPRSRDLLETAHSELQARAARIGDPSIRERVLNNVSEHREIVAAWRLGACRT